MGRWLEALDRWLGSLNSQTGLKLIGLFAVISALLIYFGYRVATDVQPSPCAAEGFPGRCYRVRPEMCQFIWDKAEASCKAYIQSLSLPAGKLIGPFVFKCQLAGLDRAVVYSRKSTDECNEMFSELEDWKRHNSDIKF